jgi:hypothetical protein
VGHHRPSHSRLHSTHNLCQGIHICKCVVYAFIYADPNPYFVVEYGIGFLSNVTHKGFFQLICNSSNLRQIRLLSKVKYISGANGNLHVITVPGIYFNVICFLYFSDFSFSTFARILGDPDPRSALYSISGSNRMRIQILTKCCKHLFPVMYRYSLYCTGTVGC